MSEGRFFYPVRWRGLLVQSAVLVLTVFLTGGGIWLALRGVNSLTVYGGLGLAMIGLALTLWRLYQLYALLVAAYQVTETAVYLRWGLHEEIIPINDLLWARSERLAAPALALPGSVVGRRKHPQYGEVEFLAAERRPLVLLASSERLFAISPAQPAVFLNALQQALQLGRRGALAAQSRRPRDWLWRPLQEPLLRFLAVFTLLVLVGLPIWLGQLLRVGASVAAGFDAYGQPLAARPLSGMLWLYAFGLAIALVDGVVGLLLYAEPRWRPWTRLLWLAAALMTALLALAFYFLLMRGA